jgi:hypothetical protein
MKPSFIVTLVTATLVCVGMAFLLGAKEQRKPWPKPTPPPPASPIYHESRERVPTEEEIAHQASTHYQRLELAIESALAGTDPERREAVFSFLLPELIQVEPQRAVALLERQKPGEARETLRTEMARQWIARDMGAAVAWMKSLDERERRDSAAAAAKSIAPYDPAGASRLAHEFELHGPLRAAGD